jgi:hypothetical protein
LGIKKNIETELDKFRQLEEQKAGVEQKLDELIKLLEQADINSEDARVYKERFNNAIQKDTVTRDQLKMYEQLDDTDMSRMDMLNELGRLLTTTQLDNKVVHKYKKEELLSKAVIFIIGLTMIGLGFGMIVLPQPASFEIFTLFYITADDGVTLMDVISLLIVLTGVYLTITAMKKKTV